MATHVFGDGARNRPRPAMPGRPRIAAALLVAALGLASTAGAQQAAPAASWPAIVAAAKKEGTVFFYGTMAVPVLQRLADGFRKVYPDIKVELTRMNSGPMMSRLDQERSSGVDGADLTIHTDYGWFQDRAKEGKLFKPVGPSMNGWPAAFFYEGSFFAGSYEAFVLAYNTRLVSNPPRTYSDLLKPEFNGKLGIPQVPAAIIIAWYDWLDKTQGMDFPSKVMAQNPKVFISSPPLAQAIASGEIAVSLVNNPSSIKPLQVTGAPISYTVPNPAFGFATYVATVGWSKRPNAGLVFADWLQSRDGQTVWSGTGESASALKGIPGAFETTGTITFYNPNEWPPEAQKRYVERYNQVYKK